MAQVGLSTPFSESSGLASIVWADVRPDGASPLPMTRAAAMSIPPVAAARHLLCPAIARLDLKAYPGPDGKGAALADQPGWMSRTDDSGISPFHRMLWTVDDILFEGWSLWLAERGSKGEVLKAQRCPMDRWRFHQGQVQVKTPEDTWRNALAREVVLIPGPHEGILAYGAPALRTAQSLLDAAEKAANNPAAQIELHYTGDAPMSREDIRTLVSDWVTARRGENGGVAFTPKNVEVKEHGARDAHLMIEGRNAAAVDVARIVGIRAANIDATNAGASLTYETAETRGGELVTFGLSAYMSAITARLSLDDVVPRGTVVRFDTEDQISPTGKANSEDPS